MADTFAEIAAFFDDHTDFSLSDGIILVATDFNVDEVRMWIADHFPGETIPHVQVDGDPCPLHYWMLDGRLTTPAEMVASLSGRGIAAKDRTAGQTRQVYVTIPEVRNAQWN